MCVCVYTHTHTGEVEVKAVDVIEDYSLWASNRTYNWFFFFNAVAVGY